MSDETVRVWLVAREYEHEDMVTLVYATPDGQRAVFQQRSTRMLFDSTVTAGLDVEPDRLEAVDPEDRERYATEAERMAERHDPDDEV
ncbi:hypothetical protein [Halorientalis regularis]|uniref:DUF7967 domain-containing protein n=1 Tax=Halorientalis regularis TaxID=660518 RepID=A0A1G7K598_9EURY|nr:hypothetical protein [Halorientalis regularis]SDF32302.1 hypothetical protein SAMN05216218_105174 [Halorientalis regularis]